MISTNFYLDIRGVNKGDDIPLKLSITKQGRTSYIPLGVRLQTSQWDAVQKKIKDHPSKAALNNFIYSQKQKVDNIIIRLTAEEKLIKLPAVQIKNIIMDEIAPKVEKSNLFIPRFKKFAKLRKSTRTKDIYEQTIVLLLRYDKKVATMTFEQITKDWLVGFDNFLSQTERSQNSRSINFRNIRAVFNDAIDNDITSYYPFRKFMVHEVPTQKRAYDIEDLRKVFSYPVLPHEQKYIDMFKLTFFLIGINTADLFELDKIINGRITYKRAKTGRIYNIKVEPEALEIINKYKGKKRLLNLADKYKSPHSLTCAFNRNLQRIGPRTHERNELVFHPVFPDLTTYVARHSWATIAYELEIPNETIAAALGHSFGNKTTAIYIATDTRKIDEANRKVIDYVLYDKKT